MESSEVLAKVRELVAEVLALDVSEVQPTSRFFEDLDGESIDLLDLQFRCKQVFGVEIVSIDRSVDLVTDEAGRLTPAAMEQLKKQLPFLDYERFEREPLKNRMTELFTIDAITQLVCRGLAQPSPS